MYSKTIYSNNTLSLIISISKTSVEVDDKSVQSFTVTYYLLNTYMQSLSFAPYIKKKVL